MLERRYLKNVTSKTLAWYNDSFRAFEGTLHSEATIKQRIEELWDRGVSATSVNSWLRSINSYLRCKGAGFRLPKLIEGQKILATLKTDQIQRLQDFKPKNR